MVLIRHVAEPFGHVNIQYQLHDSRVFIKRYSVHEALELIENLLQDYTATRLYASSEHDWHKELIAELLDVYYSIWLVYEEYRTTDWQALKQLPVMVRQENRWVLNPVLDALQMRNFFGKAGPDTVLLRAWVLATCPIRKRNAREFTFLLQLAKSLTEWQATIRETDEAISKFNV